MPSLRAKRSNPSVRVGRCGLLRRFAPRNDGQSLRSTILPRKPANTAAVTVKQATLDLLRAFGIRKVFGNPGSTELPFLSDWPDDIDYVLGLQEASVIGMADGYAQATRNAGFVNLHSAAGVGNALGNIFTAHRNQTPLVITAGQQARSILPLQPFLYAERASEFPRPYVKFSIEPARAEDVPAAIARAYYVAMQPPCGPTFVSVPIDDWTHPTQPIEARNVSREVGPDPAAMKALAAALAASKRPAFVVGPGVDRAQAVDLMVRLGGEDPRRGLGQPVFGALQFPGTASAICRLPACLAGATVGCAARPRSGGRDRRAGLYLSRRRPRLDLRRRDHDLPDHRRSRCRGGHAGRHQHHRHHEAGAGDAARAAARDQARDAGGPQLAACAARGRSDPRRILLHTLSRPCPTTPCWWRKPPRIVRRCRNSCRCAARTVSTPWRAAASARPCRPRSASRWDARACGPSA